MDSLIQSPQLHLKKCKSTALPLLGASQDLLSKHSACPGAQHLLQSSLELVWTSHLAPQIHRSYAVTQKAEPSRLHQLVPFSSALQLVWPKGGITGGWSLLSPSLLGQHNFVASSTKSHSSSHANFFHSCRCSLWVPPISSSCPLGSKGGAGSLVLLACLVYPSLVSFNPAHIAVKSSSIISFSVTLLDCAASFLPRS